MKMPSKVRVGHADFSLRLNPEVNDHASAGQIRMMRDTIEIMPDLAPAYLRVTVWHELLHAMIHQLGYPQQDGNEENERFVDGLSHKIVELVRNNPELIIWTHNMDPESEAPIEAYTNGKQPIPQDEAVQ